MTCTKWPLLGSGEVKCVTKPKIKLTLYPCHYYTTLSVRCVLCFAFYCVSHLARRWNRLHTATYARKYGSLPYSRRIHLNVTCGTDVLETFHLDEEVTACSREVCEKIMVAHLVKYALPCTKSEG